MSRTLLLSFAALLLLSVNVPVYAQKQFGFDNRKPSGQPYLKPEETVKRFQVQPGYEVKLFAGEPDVINPVAFTIDERGRLWVVENFEYPAKTPPGQKPRDRIKILEDTDSDSKADKITIWADGQTLPIGWELASGIEVGHGGVFFGAPPYLFFLSDTDGDGKCDKQEILLKGFGSQDTHETLNTFQWGPDSKLYGLHGVFTHSDIDGVKLNAAVWRLDPGPARTFDIFAEGTSNPWGMDFDSHGQCFLACCVIPHLFHMVPGGTYKRQAGSSFNPYAYGLLNEICDHIHHKESGWAHAGLLYLDGNHVPEPLRGSLIMGSIHGCSIKRDVLRPNRSTYIGSHAEDFIVSGDKNFRPINLRWGHDGSIYMIDWHDQNPCHQAAKDSWDKERGRIYKIQRTGAPNARPVDLAKKSSKELVELLKNDVPYQYRTALRLLSERRDKSVIGDLQQLIESKEPLHALRGLWGLYAVGGFDEAAANAALKHDDLWMRYWSIRFAGESGKVSTPLLDRFAALAKSDPAPQVRLQLASTCQQLKKQDVLPILQKLMTHKDDANDACLPLMIWLALESRLQAPAQEKSSTSTLDWLREHAPGNALITEQIVPRIMRRLVAENRAENLQACIAFIGSVQDAGVRRRALEGLSEAYKNRQVEAPANWKAVYSKLLKDGDPAVETLARRLAVTFQDPQAITRALAAAVDGKAALAARQEAVRDIALARPPKGLPVLQQLLKDEKEQELLCEVCRAFASYDQPEVPASVLAEWKRLPPKVRAEAVNVLAGRKSWAAELLNAVGKGLVPRTELNDNTVLRINAFRDAALTEQIEKVWGRFRPTPAELETLIAKMRGHLFEESGSFDRGRKVFDNQCAKCHKFDGRGATVGPNLDGAGRDIEYLLTNILDPNRVIGQPYFVHLIELKDGRIEQGLMVAEDNVSITLKAENDVVKVFQRKDIEGKLLVQPKSIMPEGLANNMTVQDFRDLVRYVMAHPFLTHVAMSRHFPSKQPPFDPASAEVEKEYTFTPVASGVAGRIPLPPTKEPNMAIAIAETVKAPNAVTTQLQLGAAQPLRVYLNGKMVYQGTPGPAPASPDQAAVDVQLREGDNHLLFVVESREGEHGLYARFLDAERKLQHAP